MDGWHALEFGCWMEIGDWREVICGTVLAGACDRDS